MTLSKVQENRAAKAEQIKDVARLCLAKDGAAGLSLREIARQMNESSSALYRYFPNRDALITALIIDAYNDLGSIAEKAWAAAQRKTPKNQFVAVSKAIRSWSLEHRDEFSLIFGSPIPDYAAPESTITPATRIPTVLSLIAQSGIIDKSDFGPTPLPSRVLDVRVAELLPDMSPDQMSRCLMAWSALFGLLSFELFGHFVNSVAKSEEYFSRAVYEIAQQLGLTA